jgi:CHAD domain-containing protein
MLVLFNTALKMETNSLLSDFIDQRWEKYRTDLKACRAEFTEEAIHDLRVATRRLSAALQFIRSIDRQPLVNKLRRKLKKQLDGFDKLRDVQVMLANIDKNIGSLPELEPFQQYLKKREKRQLRAAEKHVQAIKRKTFRKRRLHKILEPFLTTPAESLLPHLFQAVDEAYSTVKQRYGEMDPRRPITIHRVRVAFKKFRYMVECIQPALPGFSEDQLKNMQNYQTLMGDIHDVEIFLDTLKHFSVWHEQFDIEPARRSYEQTFAQVLSVYLAQKDEVHSFWRATPEGDFPWESEPKNQEAA